MIRVLAVEHEGVIRKRWDDATRTFHEYDERGLETLSRPYATEENAAADAAAQAQADAEAARERAELADAVLDATAALMEAAHTDGETWTAPTGAHDTYALGVTVKHAGKTWVNLNPANVWAPGTTGWREVVAEGPAAWVQPLGAHDAYPLGSKVTHKGKTWVNLTPANVWAPGVYGWA